MRHPGPNRIFQLRLMEVELLASLGRLRHHHEISPGIVARCIESGGSSVPLVPGCLILMPFSAEVSTLDGNSLRLSHERHEISRQQRLAREESLIFMAAPLFEKRQLLLGLHAFRDDRQQQTFRQHKDRAHDSGVVSVVRDLLEERAINLQLVQGKTTQIGQGGIARPEVVY